MKRELKGTGKQVTAVGLGGMPLSLRDRPDADRAVVVIHAFLERGGDFIDTANVYCIDTSEVGHNERLIRDALRAGGGGDGVRVATKGGLTKEGSGWDCDGRPEWIRRSCEQSLSDLGVDCIFLYQLHAPDPNVPLAETMGELARLRAEGKIRHVGLSNVDAAQIDAAAGIVPVVSVQNKLNVRHKKTLRLGVVDACRSRGITFIAHSPVGGHFGHRRIADDPELLAIASRHGATPQQVALAWLLHLGPHVVPIPGASRIASVASSLEAMKLKLPTADVETLTALPDW